MGAGDRTQGEAAPVQPRGRTSPCRKRPLPPGREEEVVARTEGGDSRALRTAGRDRSLNRHLGSVRGAGVGPGRPSGRPPRGLGLTG